MIQILGVESREGKKSSVEIQGHQDSVLCCLLRAPFFPEVPTPVL